MKSENELDPLTMERGPRSVEYDTKYEGKAWFCYTCDIYITNKEAQEEHKDDDISQCIPIPKKTDKPKDEGCSGC